MRISAQLDSCQRVGLWIRGLVALQVLVVSKVALDLYIIAISASRHVMQTNVCRPAGLMHHCMLTNCPQKSVMAAIVPALCTSPAVYDCIAGQDRLTECVHTVSTSTGLRQLRALTCSGSMSFAKLACIWTTHWQRLNICCLVQQNVV